MFTVLFSYARRYFVSLVLIALYFIVSTKFFTYFCPSLIFFGLPCPACGLTRASVLFFTGHFKESFQMHPMFIFVLLLSISYVVTKYRFPHRTKLLNIPLVILIISSFVVYIIRMHYLFPHTAPMIVNDHSVLHLMAVFFRNH